MKQLTIPKNLVDRAAILHEADDLSERVAELSREHLARRKRHEDLERERLAYAKAVRLREPGHTEKGLEKMNAAIRTAEDDCQGFELARLTLQEQEKRIAPQAQAVLEEVETLVVEDYSAQLAEALDELADGCEDAARATMESVIGKDAKVPKLLAFRIEAAAGAAAKQFAKPPRGATVTVIEPGESLEEAQRRVAERNLETLARMAARKAVRRVSSGIER